jgi:hypothetical protein
MKHIMLFENFNAINEEFEDLELKNIGKKLFSVAKKHGLKPQYSTKTVNFESKPQEAELGYGSSIVVADGMLTVGVYDRGLLQSIQRGGFPGIDAKETDRTSSDASGSNKQALNSALGILFKELTAEIPQDKFEIQSSSRPNEFGVYIIKARMKKQ